MNKGMAFGKPVSVKPCIELNHCYTSKIHGMFLVKHFSANNILVTIIDIYGREKKTSFLTFDENVHRDCKCTHISRKQFVAEYRKHTRDYELKFLYEDSPIIPNRGYGRQKEKTVRSVYQVPKRTYYCY